MSVFSKYSARLRAKRLKKNSKTHKSTRKEYLLNEKTPFDVMEAFRNLKASLSVSVARKSEKGVAVMATSSFPEDGKTTVVTNLALMFAQSDAKVVLIDADIRKGRVGRYFHRRSTPGLSDYLSGQAKLEDVLKVSDVNENLFVIPCGTHSPRPYELLESEHMQALVEELKTRFDYVIFDTPPVLVVSDAIAMAPYMDGCVLVCRHLVSYVSDIQKSLQTLSFAKVNVLGLIVNDYHAPTGKMYGGYKHYYSYGDYANPIEDSDAPADNDD